MTVVHGQNLPAKSGPIELRTPPDAAFLSLVVDAQRVTVYLLGSWLVPLDQRDDWVNRTVTFRKSDEEVHSPDPAYFIGTVHVSGTAWHLFAGNH